MHKQFRQHHDFFPPLLNWISMCDIEFHFFFLGLICQNVLSLSSVYIRSSSDDTVVAFSQLLPIICSVAVKEGTVAFEYTHCGIWYQVLRTWWNLFLRIPESSTTLRRKYGSIRLAGLYFQSVAIVTACFFGSYKPSHSITNLTPLLVSMTACLVWHLCGILCIFSSDE